MNFTKYCSSDIFARRNQPNYTFEKFLVDDSPRLYFCQKYQIPFRFVKDLEITNELKARRKMFEKMAKFPEIPDF